MLRSQVAWLLWYVLPHFGEWLRAAVVLITCDGADPTAFESFILGLCVAGKVQYADAGTPPPPSGTADAFFVRILKLLSL